jgi:ADP-ribose pyrophosphatase YjhB (NUDIX family)
MFWILSIVVGGLVAAAAWWVARARVRAPEPLAELEPETDGKWHSAGGLVISNKGKIALVLQRDRRRRLRWTLPKGRIDAGERAEEAALREVYEETGLAARIIRPILAHEGARHYTHYFEMALVRDDQTHDAETRKVRFVKPAKALRLLESRRDLLVIEMWQSQRKAAPEVWYDAVAKWVSMR